MRRVLALLLALAVAAPAPAQLLPPLPGGSLIVTLTSPSGGSTVSGTIPVSASVSIVGTLTVSRVEFFRNGNFIGSDSGAPYSVSWNTTTVSNGSHTLSAVAVDLLGVRWTSNSVTVNVSNGPPPDTSAPSVSITSPGNGATVSGTINVTASASDNVGVTGVRFLLDGVVRADDTSSPYSISWNTATASNGSHTLTAVARDAAGNTRTSAPVTVTVANDTTRPTVTINQAATQADPTGASPINFTVVFSESVSGFTGSDVSIGGTAGGTKTRTVTGGPRAYNVAVSGMTGSGTVIASIGAGRASDAAGNTNTASTSTDNSVTFNLPDTTRPTVTINQAAGQADPTSASPINFTVVFSESVSGFTGTDVSIGGTAGGTKTVSVTGGPGTYTAAVSGMTSSGTVIASIGAGVAQDAAGNTNTASTSTDNSVTFNGTPPAPTIASFAPASGPVGTVVTITGNNFNGATGVAFNGVPATTASLDSDTQITATVPSGATTGPITVTTPGGIATSSTSFEVTPAAGGATITSFSPASGPVGTVVTITGNNFNGATGVAFNGVPATTASLDSNTQITATVPSGAATGPITVTTPGGTATSSTSFTVDTATPGVTRSEESAATFAGTGWVPRGAEIAAFSDGTAASSNVAGDTSSFTFTGTAVSWIGLKCSICGIATVSIDGGAPIPVDTAGAAAVGSPGLASEVVFTSPTLGAGTHSLVITVTGNAHIVVDAFDVTGGTGSDVTRIEQDDAAVSYAGTWVRDEANPIASGGTFSESNAPGAALTLSFTGTEVRWLGARYGGGGIARVSVDGTFVGEVNTYSASPALGVVFTAAVVSSGAHTLTIEVTGSRDPAAIDAWVIIDAFDVTR